MGNVEYAFIKFDRSPYLEDAQEALGALFDMGVNECGLRGSAIADAFLAKGLAEEFERMNPVYVAGKSGADLLASMAECLGVERASFGPVSTVPSPDYWTGWMLVFFQQETGIPYRRIFETVPYEEIVSMYHPLHEADESKFVEVLLAALRENAGQTRLAIQRCIMGFSQVELASHSGVSLRSIQMYEQRNKNINHASVETVYRLARVLACDIADLVEF